MVIQAILLPDDGVDTWKKTNQAHFKATDPPQRKSVSTHLNHQSQNSRKEDRQRKRYRDLTIGRNEDIDGDKDVIMMRIPEYISDVEGGPEGQEESLRGLIMSLKEELQVVGKKVAAVERSLGITQHKVEEMVGQMNEAAAEQETYREKARNRAEKPAQL